ncbi:MAG: hypothetical protein FWG84_07930 [Bacteroidales bacterium]|nr:hypothetical protein [Bacteroidales bacterium]
MIKYLVNIVCLMLLTTGILAQRPQGTIEPEPAETPAVTPPVTPTKPPPAPAPDNTSKKLAEDLRTTQNSLNEAWENQQKTQERLAATEQKLTETENKLANAEKKVTEAEKKVTEAEKKVTETEKIYGKSKEIVSKIEQIQPLIVKDIQIGLYDEAEKLIGKYGRDLPNTKATFLGFKMYYISLLETTEELSFTITLNYPDKKIAITSTKKSSYQETVTIRPGESEALFKPRQGQHGANYYPTGTYSIEIQYKDTFIGKFSFTINDKNDKN